MLRNPIVAKATRCSAYVFKASDSTIDRGLRNQLERVLKLATPVIELAVAVKRIRLTSQVPALVLKDCC
jgi:hypothetical protein